MPSDVDQPTVTGLDTGPDSSTVNVADEPSATAPAAVTETVSMPWSTIVVSAVAVSAVTVPADVVAPLSVTDTVSPRSSTESSTVGISIVPLETPAPSVSEPNGAV